MRIKWQANGPIQGGEKIGQRYHISINPAPWLMKHHHDLHGRARVQWLVPDFIADETAEQQVHTLVRDQVDLLLLPCFVWNIDLQLEVARLFKQHRPEAHVVMGGPQLTAHKDSSFMHEHPYVDYVVYGDGERALTDIIDYLATGTRGDWVNTVERDRVWPHEVLRDQLYWSTSPYLTQKTHIRDSLEALYRKGYTNEHVMLAVEFARGCMYRCAYCDWSQNLSNKVTRRKAEWKRELEFFKELDVSIRETDANFGQWREDLEIYDYAKSLHEPGRNFKFLVWNTAKLKRNADHFMIGNVETYGHRFILSVEDTEREVLDAIDRPSLPWSEHQALLDRVRTRLGTERFQDTAHAELMLGLPRQTLDTFRENYVKITLEGIRKIILNQWVYAVNSPGADKEYLSRHGIVFTEHRLYQPGDHDSLPPDVGEAYQMASTSPHFLKQQMVTETSYMTMTDMLTVMEANRVIQHNGVVRAQLDKVLSTEDAREQVSKIIAYVFERSARVAKDRYDSHKVLIEKYGFVLAHLL